MTMMTEEAQIVLRKTMRRIRDKLKPVKGVSAYDAGRLAEEVYRLAADAYDDAADDAVGR